ncbi:DUF61 family protein [Palaeococcus ferrophilus]|uniref:DUF61 family protein n=1 Tax=Palaeococcus ferrophilus TaxID=83868 RepID=UPI00064E17EF|nr:DUF61 family protein [Palaeococcus ferrophilus]
MPEPDEIINRELMRINLHLPRQRKSLSALLREEDPSVKLRDGSEHHFRRQELERLSEIIDESEWDRLLLPIPLEVSTLWHGYFRVRGRLEVEVIEKLLGTYDFLEEKSEITLPRYLLPRIRRELPTTTTYVFIME